MFNCSLVEQSLLHFLSSVLRTLLFNTQDIFIMVRREKATLFLCCKEETTVKELKMMIEGITKKPPDDQQLIKDDQPLADEGKTLGDYGFTTATAKAQTPAQVNLVYKAEGVKMFTILALDCIFKRGNVKIHVWLRLFRGFPL